ncbi:terminase [Rhodococcus sp. D2-41]|uniref:terminase large subunit n=1 Tax=Speluncibacter jeojiensis TaxID=2710754 RepID=UPI00240F82E5|nr:terminase large subunit [Rhodococcus sp. D2-41]MDG3012156.1 terminase [Rhodococcus sp. D2-41]
MTTSPSVDVIDNQRPRLHSCPPFFSTLGQDAIDLSAHAGLELDPWQQFVLEESLGERRGGKWAAFEIGLIVPRQNGKGAVIEARQLAAMFLTRDPMIIYSAHQFKTAKQMYRRIRDLCQQTPDLDRLVKGRYRQSNEETGIELDWGRMQFFARSNGSGRGFTGDTMFFDEAFNLDSELIADMLPTLAAVPNAQIWYVSSAGMEASEQLAKIRTRGIAGEDRLSFYEWSAPDDADLDDERAWWIANPGLDIRLDRDFVRSVERNGMDDEKFARERLGIWVDPNADDHERVIDPEVWSGMADASPKLIGPIALAVDMDPSRQWCSIAAASRTATWQIHLEVGFHEAPTAGVVSTLVDLVARWNPCALVIDKQSPAMSLLPDLLNEGIEPETTTAAQLVQACGGFYDDAVGQLLSHTGDPLLAESLEGATKRELSGGGWAWNRKGAQVISPLVAATLARWALLTFGARATRTPQRPTFTKTDSGGVLSETADLMSAGF